VNARAECAAKQRVLANGPVDLQRKARTLRIREAQAGPGAPALRILDKAACRNPISCQNSGMISRVLGVIAAAAVLIPGADAKADQWPSWRGPQANGSTEQGSYPVKWDASTALWKVALPGKGCSTPIVWNKNIYLELVPKVAIFGFGSTARS
jgi:hypothetical protein